MKFCAVHMNFEHKHGPREPFSILLHALPKREEKLSEYSTHIRHELSHYKHIRVAS